MQAPVVGGDAGVVVVGGLSGTPEVGGLAYTVEEAFDRGAIASRESRKTVGIGGTFLIIFN